MKKLGFTLAEVLITLGIIGVVAALTIPSLIQNYQKHVWVNQLKKSVSVVENSFHLAMAQDEVENLMDTSLLKTLLVNGDDDWYGTWHRFPEFVSKYKDYIKIIDTKADDTNFAQYKTLNGTEYNNVMNYPIYLADGSILYLFIDPTGYSAVNYDLIGSYYIDVNGLKGPNTFGRDLFEFLISPYGTVYPNYSKPVRNIYEKNYGYDIYPADIVQQLCNPSGNADANGGSCAARIMEDGWKMNY